MPLRFLELGEQFRQFSSTRYPPFKNGQYMEEYFYNHAVINRDNIETQYVYIPVFWTNLQVNAGFLQNKQKYEKVINNAINKMPSDTKYFTIVQHDDGIGLRLNTNNILIFGGCTGHVPLPLIYQDVTNRLETAAADAMVVNQKKEYLASFVGTITHQIRQQLCANISETDGVFIQSQNNWSSAVPHDLANVFIEKTLLSKFCLAPRGYGRSSFRFFEAILLNTIPVYFWSDIEWLPYKDIIDYTKFAISINQKDVHNTMAILKSISHEKYLNMLEELKKNKNICSLDFMCNYVIYKIKQG